MFLVLSSAPSGYQLYLYYLFNVSLIDPVYVDPSLLEYCKCLAHVEDA